MLDSARVPRDIPRMISTVSLVALGGAIGASLRYLAGVGVFRMFGHQEFPLGIITVNVIGSCLIGAFVVAAAHRGLGHYNPFVATGLMGGFTTFSSFSLETVNLIEKGAYGQAGLYIALSVGLSVAALFAGLIIAREVWV